MPMTARDSACLRFAGARVFREMPGASIKEQIHAIMTEYDRIQGKVQVARNPEPEQESAMDLTTLRRKIESAQRATLFLKTTATLFNIAALATTGESSEESRLPDPVEISELLESLAMDAEDFVCHAETELTNIERGQI